MIVNKALLDVIRADKGEGLLKPAAAQALIERLNRYADIAEVEPAYSDMGTFLPNFIQGEFYDDMKAAALALTPQAGDSPAEPHCNTCQSFDYDCIDCSDELARAQARGEYPVPDATQPEPAPSTPAQHWLDTNNGVASKGWQHGFNECAARFPCERKLALHSVYGSDGAMDELAAIIRQAEKLQNTPEPAPDTERASLTANELDELALCEAYCKGSIYGATKISIGVVCAALRRLAAAPDTERAGVADAVIEQALTDPENQPSQWGTIPPSSLPDRKVITDEWGFDYDEQDHKDMGWNACLDAIAMLISAPRPVERAGVAWRYFADGPQGFFLANDLSLASQLVDAFDKDDDWTITDMLTSAPRAGVVELAIAHVRAQYPIDLFIDAHHGARMARLTCDNILREYQERLAALRHDGEDGK
ncbi:MAG: hypothetical protein M3R16_00820 [Pseudomonadota bacterium]|nr:hypothetical protein [Pseudomonadota bacterium]